jgi:hypothetical protein
MNASHIWLDDTPFCIGCNEYFTIEHYLHECYAYSQVRYRYSHSELFDLVTSKTLIDYLKEINMFSNI